MVAKKFFLLTENCRLYHSDPSEICVSAKWFVYYYIAGERKQVRGNINAYSTVADRIKAAKELAKNIELDLYRQKQMAIENTPFVIGLKNAFKNRCKTLRPKSVSSYSTKVNAFIKFLADNVIKVPTQKDVTRFFEGLTAHANTLSVYRVTLFSLVEDM